MADHDILTTGPDEPYIGTRRGKTDYVCVLVGQ